MQEHFVLALLLGTSLLGIAVGAALGLPLRDIPAAFGKVLETVGLMLAFFALNLGLGAGVLLLGRLVAREFVSLYYANDLALLAGACLQGLAVQWWRAAGAGRRAGRKRP